MRVRDGGIACMGAFSKIVLYPVFLEIHKECDNYITADCCCHLKILVTASGKINKKLRILEGYVH